MTWFLKGAVLWTVLCFASIGVVTVIVIAASLLNRARHPDEEDWQPVDPNKK